MEYRARLNAQDLHKRRGFSNAGPKSITGQVLSPHNVLHEDYLRQSNEWVDTWDATQFLPYTVAGDYPQVTHLDDTRATSGWEKHYYRFQDTADPSRPPPVTVLQRLHLKGVFALDAGGGWVLMRNLHLQGTLIIYNLLGQEVRRLASGRYQSGTYQATWDGYDEAGRAVAGGVYVYRLNAGAFTRARTMVLMK